MKAVKSRWARDSIRTNRSHSIAAWRSAIEALEGRTLLSSVVVNSVSDTATGVMTLRDAITIANSSTTPTAITFASSVFGSARTITLSGSQLTLKATEPVTITGPAAGVTISGNGKSRVFLVNFGVTAKFTSLKITGGMVSGSSAVEGAGIANIGSLTLNDCTITANTVVSSAMGSAEGGGIGSAGPLTLSDCTVSLNRASGSGGGIYSTASLNINGSTISSDRSDHGDGGGIYSEAGLAVTRSTISSNLSGNGFGGGISVGSDSSLSLTSSTVSGNSSVGGTGGNALGGGIAVNGTFALKYPVVSVMSSTVSGNSAAGVGPSGFAYGGGIYCGRAITVTDSTVANNRALGGNGSPGTFDGGASGGGIYVEGNGTDTIKLLDSTLSGDTVTGGSGGMSSGYVYGAGLDIESGNVLATNTILSGDAGASDIEGFLAHTSADNLIGTGGGLTNGVNGNRVGVTSPKLAPLGNYGGLTQTMPPLTGSPVLNHGSNALIPAGLTADQRALPRVVNGVVDIGAVEPQNPVAVRFPNSVATGKAGVKLSALIVEVVDSGGNIATTDSSVITLAIASGPTGAKLTGTVSVAASNGVAVFSSLLFSKAGTYSLKGIDGKLGTAKSLFFSIAG